MSSCGSRRLHYVAYICKHDVVIGLEARSGLERVSIVRDLATETSGNRVCDIRKFSVQLETFWPFYNSKCKFAHVTQLQLSMSSGYRPSYGDKVAISGGCKIWEE